MVIKLILLCPKSLWFVYASPVSFIGKVSISFLRYILKIIEISNFLLQRLDKNDFPSLVALPLSSVPCALLIEHRNARGYTMNPLRSYIRVLMKLHCFSSSSNLHYANFQFDYIEPVTKAEFNREFCSQGNRIISGNNPGKS